MSHVDKQRRNIFGAITSVVVIMTVASGTASPASGREPATSGAGASTAQVLNAVGGAPRIKTVPNDLTPPLRDYAQNPPPSAVTPDGLLSQDGCVPATQNQATVGKCVFGDPKGSKTIVLVGDSHAEMWWSGFNAVAMRAHWKLVLLIKSACPAVDLNFWYWPTNTPYPGCNAWHKYVTNRINKMGPAVVVFTSWWHGNGIIPNGYAPTPAQWQAGLEQAITSITSPGTKKVVWGDIPYLAQAGPLCLAAHETDVQACSTPASEAVLTDHEQTLKAAALATGATYVATTPWLCTSTCTAVVGKYSVYADANHINSSYALYLQGAIATALQPVMG
jgi:hypothetical protein